MRGGEGGESFCWAVPAEDLFRPVAEFVLDCSRRDRCFGGISARRGSGRRRSGEALRKHFGDTFVSGSSREGLGEDAQSRGPVLTSTNKHLIFNEQGLVGSPVDAYPLRPFAGAV